MTATVWTKFFWSDWSNDPLLRLCSLGAQGLWMRCLCVASEGEPYGYLTVKGRQLGVSDIARLAGVTETECDALLSELDRNGVFSRARNGAIYSRRLVRDQKKAAVARKNGEKGGNPTLSNKKEKSPSVKPVDKLPDKPQSPESTSHISRRDDDDALGWPTPKTLWVDELIAATGCAHPVGDLWPRISAPVLLGWHDIDRFEWRDVVAGVSTTLLNRRSNEPLHSWRYFAPAIAQARQARTQPTPEAPDAVRRSKSTRSRAKHNQDTTVSAFERVFGSPADGDGKPAQPD
jgi:hypothetical protein